MVRIKDIAEKAGVSTGTVDRVLHERGRVAEDVRQKVLEIAKELNYQPNLLARTLVNNRTYDIAALIPDPAQDDYWQAPQTGIEKAAAELTQYGVRVTQFIFDPLNANSFKEQAAEVRARQPIAILVAPIFYRESLAYFKQWKEAGIPFALFNTHIPDYEPLIYIGQDSYQSGYLAAKLLQYGHPEGGTFLVVHIDVDLANSSHLINKEQGFYDYFHQHSAGKMFKIVQADLGNSTSEAFQDQLDKLLLQNPEVKGIFVTNSKAHTVAQYLQTKGISQIRLIGYDLMEKNLEFLNKGTIDFLINQNPKGQGYWGIYGLADQLVFKKKTNPIKYLPLDIITKENLHYYIEADL
ncbi:MULTISPECIES: LacI family DNA-binding transcriptional regulator [Rufibacter]|uniref:LacI family transcriptional regulator n=1 Tax=Rufibacter quisquiliarum TaxID=1549639 RepID=A0A839GNF9_9BACT|nr:MULTISPECIES: LacI family DNA-binding transcriptional regulator [Rufibacter]MBA9079473.1 LacI family transcriptional regulator [Rufibacter quisquiliarum]